MFEAASSGFSSSVLPIFLPLLTDIFATDLAWKELESSSPFACSSIDQVDYVKCVPGKGARPQTLNGLHDLPKLRVHIANLRIDPLESPSVFELLAFVLAGSLVDYVDQRKNVMTISTLIGSVACVLCVLITKPDLWWLGVVFLIVANVSYGLSWNAYDSYLRCLTKASCGRHDFESMSTLEQQLVTDALMGITFGAISGATFVKMSFGFASLPTVSRSEALRGACVTGGIWPGCFFSSSLSIRTDSQRSIQWVHSTPSRTTTELATLAVLVNLFAMINNPLFVFIQQNFKWDSNQLVILGLSLLTVLPVYGVISGCFTPDGSLGQKHISEMYTFACWYGLSLGALLSYSRTLFIDLNPVGKEVTMFSPWSLSSWGSAWLGPSVFAAMVQVTGNLRSAFVYTLLVVCVSVVLLYLFIDNEEGLFQSSRLSVKLAFDSGKSAVHKKALSKVSYAEESQHFRVAGAI